MYDNLLKTYDTKDPGYMLNIVMFEECKLARFTPGYMLNIVMFEECKLARFTPGYMLNIVKSSVEQINE